MALPSPTLITAGRKAGAMLVLLGTTVLAQGAMTQDALAQTACTPASPASGDSVSCSGTGTGVVNQNLNALTITVEAGATVTTSSGRAFRFGDDVTLTNAGTISSSGDHAIQGLDGAVISNSGTITSTAGDGINVDADAVIDNSGSITASDDGIQAEDGTTVTNSGAITAGAAGVKVEGDDATLTNSETGTITAGEDGLRAEGINAVVTNAGTITSGEDGIKVDDDYGTVTNSGSITAGSTDEDGTVLVEGDGIQTENHGTVTNSGTITASKDGINVGDDSSVTNAGSVYGADDGVQIGARSSFTNEEGGMVTAVGEGINANEVDVTILNYGTITAGDDGINAATGAYIENWGTIISNGGAQDGVDLDSGTVINHGTILAIGVEDGIDFDPSTDASLVVNEGTIEGEIGINTDPADTGAQTVVNAGTITGRGGLAVNLGAGDDTLVLEAGSVLNGAIEMGDGSDTLVVNYVAFDRLRFGSVIETVETAGASIIGTSEIILLDDDALRAADRDSQTLAYGIARQALTLPAGRGFWTAGRGQSFDESDSHGDRNLVAGSLGYDFDLGGQSLGGFLSQSRAGDLDATVLGLRYMLSQEGHDFSALLYAGKSRGTDIAGTEAGDGSLAGIAARYAHVLRKPEQGQPGFDLAVEGGWGRNAIDGYDLTDLDTRIDGRDVTGGYLRLEAGMPMLLAEGNLLRGYLALTRLDGSADDITARFDGVETRIAGDDDLDRSTVSLGATWSKRMAGGALIDAGLEASFGKDADREVAASFVLRLPFGG